MTMQNQELKEQIDKLTVDLRMAGQVGSATKAAPMTLEEVKAKISSPLEAKSSLLGEKRPMAVNRATDVVGI